MRRDWRRLIASATPARRRRFLCLLTAGGINAGLFLVLSLGLHRGGDGLAADEAMTVVFLATAPPTKLLEIPKTKPKPPHIDPPQRPSVDLGDDPEPELAGPPTETAESVQQRLAAAARVGDAERRRALECSDVSTAAVDHSRTVAVLSVRVGIDGRVVDAEIDRSSGRPRVDKLLLQCARHWGPFPLAIIDGRVVDSWQSIEWPSPAMIGAESVDMSRP